MDAQNAVRPDKTNVVAAPRPGPDTAAATLMASASTLPTTTTTSAPTRTPAPASNSNSASSASATAPLELARHTKPFPPASATLEDDRDSDAETIVLPGKDGHSPSKARKVRQEDNNDDGGNAAAVTSHRSSGDDNGLNASVHRHRDRDRDRDRERERERERERDGSGLKVQQQQQPAKKKRPLDGHLGGGGSTSRGDPGSAPLKPASHPAATRVKDLSSGLSSAPTSPPRKRRRSADTSDDDDDDASRAKSPRITIPSKHNKDRPPKPSFDRATHSQPQAHKRKSQRADSDDDDEAENRRPRRQRTTTSEHPDTTYPNRLLEGNNSNSNSNNSSNNNNNNNNNNPKPSATAKGPHHDSTTAPPRNRSQSPNRAQHRRSLSTQIPSNGLGHKKRRLPPPLQATDYQSDESSASGSPHPRSFKLRSLATPAPAESNASPVKMGGTHKKSLDAHGLTHLARSCARGEYETVKQRLAERPDDLNVADYAGNTPLQIAAINGHEDIVKLLIDAGCNVDCVNYDKDTPLLDAVDNGHLGVVRLLLDAGVNPRKANVSGEEPLDRVKDHMENAAEMRAAITDAKQRMGNQRRPDDGDRDRDRDRDSNAPESPRRSPTAASVVGQAVAGPRRGGTVRANKTSNHLLYIPVDDKTLRQAAGRGDEETVMHILQVRNGCDDAEAMVAAARGGHDLVMQLLLALGNANPDPPPVKSIPADFSTPMLAAIGQENTRVIRLLLDQADFDPTRRFRTETYFEIARRRQGPHWKEEQQMLKDAYEKADSKKSKDAPKTKSPNRHKEKEKEKEKERSDKETIKARDVRDVSGVAGTISGANRDPKERERERERERASSHKEKEKEKEHSTHKVTSAKLELKPDAPKASKRSMTGLSRDMESTTKKGNASTSLSAPAKNDASSPKEQRRANSFNHPDDHTSPKRGPGRPKKDDAKRDRNAETQIPSINVSDREASPAISHKAAPKPRWSESEVPGASSEGETPKPRRKLVSKGELNAEQRQRKRRASLVSIASSSHKEPSSPHEPRNDDSGGHHQHHHHHHHNHHPEKVKPDLISEKYHDRTKALKRDDSKDRLLVSGDGSAKRHRSSVTPPRLNLGADKDDSEAPAKRRRLDVDAKDPRSKQRHTSSPEPKPRKTAAAAPPHQHQPPKIALPQREISLHEDDDHRPSSHKAKPTPDAAHRKDTSAAKQAPDTDKSVPVKSEDGDVEMKDVFSSSELRPKHEVERRRREDAKRPAEAGDAHSKKDHDRREDKRKKLNDHHPPDRAEAKPKEDPDRAREDDEHRRKAKEERRKRLEEERKRKEENENEKDRQRLQKEREREEELEHLMEDEVRFREEEQRKREEEEQERQRQRQKLEEQKKREEEEQERQRQRQKLEEQKKREEEEQERQRQRQRLEEQKKREEAEEQRRREEEERKREEERKQEEEQRRREDERRREEERQIEEQRKKEEEEQRRRKEEERRLEEQKQREEEEERRRLEEQKWLQEEQEEQRKKEEERRRLEEQQKKAEEEEQLQREQEEKRRLEEEREWEAERQRQEQLQLQREAEDRARLQREEEERQERERREQMAREDMERKRAAREAELQRLIQEEQERARIARLPGLLQWFETCANPKVPEVATMFRHMEGVRYDTVRPEATGRPDGREQWVLNTNVALLLGEKDLELARYTAWERIPASNIAKRVIMRLEADHYALTSPTTRHLASSLPGYFGEGVNPERPGAVVHNRMRQEAIDKFMNMDLFFVKLSDLLFIIPTIPHLRNVRLSVGYRELPDDERKLVSLSTSTSSKWKSDPDAARYHGWAPQSKYYVNGALVGEDLPKLAAVSSLPFPETHVPRRNLRAVPVDDPEYAKLCREQGLDYLLNGEAHGSPSLPNGIHATPSPRNIRDDEPVSPHHVSPTSNGIRSNGVGHVNGEIGASAHN